jgi:TP901 family phage tail tape measure protein
MGFQRGLAPIAKGAKVAFGGVALGIGFAVKAAANFEQSLNIMKAVSGATAGQMRQVSAVAKQLGADTQLPATSAKDAADAMTELAKGGLSVKESMAAARGVLQLSAAAQIENAEAATITARALNAFGLQGKDATRVADLLAATSNASTAEIGDVAMAMQQAGASAKQMGVPIEDLTTAIGLMANAGITGSDAGTSLKTMMARLLPSTVKAKAAVKELGVSVFDADGKFIGVRAAIGKYTDALSGLNPKQRQAAIQTIFGSDAQRAANIVLGAGVGQYDKMKDAVTREGAAKDLAASKTKGLSGAIEGLKSSAETMAISFGSQALPAVTSLARAGVTALQWTEQHQGATKALVGGVLALSAGVILLNTGLSIYNSRIAVSILRTKALRIAFATTPFGIAAVAIGLVAAAMLSASENTDRFADATKRAKDALANMGATVDAAKRADLELAAARSSQRLAAIGVTDAEIALKQARQAGNPREVERAEAGLQAARVAARQAALGVEEAEHRANEARTKARSTVNQARNSVKNLTQDFRDLTVGSKAATGALGGARLGVGATASVAGKGQDDVAAFARKMLEVAAQGDKAASKLRATHPQLARTASQAADAARTAANLATALGRLPTRKEINVQLNVNANAAAHAIGISNAIQLGSGQIRKAGGGIEGAVGSPQLILAHGGEVVLTPEQQRMIGPPETFKRLFQKTGGDSRGISFAGGGFVGKKAKGGKLRGIEEFDRMFGILQRKFTLPKSQLGSDYGPGEVSQLIANRRGALGALKRAENARKATSRKLAAQAARVRKSIPGLKGDKKREAQDRLRDILSRQRDNKAAIRDIFFQRKDVTLDISELGQYVAPSTEVDVGGGEAGAGGMTADQQAQWAQMEAKVAAYERAGGLNMLGGVVFQSLVAPTDAMMQHAAEVVTQGLGRQGAPASSAIGLRV